MMRRLLKQLNQSSQKMKMIKNNRNHLLVHQVIVMTAIGRMNLKRKRKNLKLLKHQKNLS